MYADNNLDAQCAEAGVYRRDCAKYINRYFPNCMLHLFDTFEEFDKRDIEKESEMNYSNSLIGDHCNFSIDTVLSKMKTSENSIIHRSYFPLTAEGVYGRLLFVNLDMDLYMPTYERLVFDSKMIRGILVHDYFADGFKGSKVAVERYICEHAGICRVPIGDGSSILLVGFVEK